MPHEDDEWDLNSPRRLRDALTHQPTHSGPQAESTPEYGVKPAIVPTSPDRPDGPLQYA